MRSFRTSTPGRFQFHFPRRLFFTCKFFRPFDLAPRTYHPSFAPRNRAFPSPSCSCPSGEFPLFDSRFLPGLIRCTFSLSPLFFSTSNSPITKKVFGTAILIASSATCPLAFGPFFFLPLRPPPSLPRTMYPRSSGRTN